VPVHAPGLDQFRKVLGVSVAHGVLPRSYHLSSPRKRGPIFQRPQCMARWVPACAGTTTRQ
jgi:hypothetical protein